MKAAVYTKTGSGKVLEIRDFEKPVPKDDEVLVRVRAASVNPLDWRLKKRRPGVDAAGEVEAVGARVTMFKPGDAVFGACRGAFAEYACGVESKLVLKPQKLSFEEAAAIPVAGLTALQVLRKGHLQPGQNILINGASGGVGTFSVQLAKSFGARVTGVCSTRNVELVRSLGADRVIDYTSDDFSQDDQRYDMILDNVGNREISVLRRVLTPNGRCLMAGAPKKPGAVISRLLVAFVSSLFARQKVTFFMAKVDAHDLMTLGELVSTGKLKAVIDRRYPLNETGNAIAYVEGGHAPAKVVIAI